MDNPLGRRQFLEVLGSTGAVAATAAAHGGELDPLAGQSQDGREYSPPTRSDRSQRTEHAMNIGALSKARLDRMHNVMTGHVERGELPGLVTLISRRGEVHVDAIGMKVAGGKDPMRRDTIFRIASMTKPNTAAATMILVEECKLRLDEPVDRLLSELANRRVLKQHRVVRVGSSDCPSFGPAVRDVSARTHLRAAGHERHRF
jgi:CubicO group peptidase (beta-lactamase class C family)